MRTKLKLLLVWYIGNIGWNLLRLVNKGRIDHLTEVIAALSLPAFLLTSPPFIPIAYGCAFFCLIIFACRINLYAVPLSFALGCLFAVFVMLSSIVPALLGIVSALGPWGVAHQSVEFPVLSIGEAWSRTAFVVAADALFVGTHFVCHRIALHDDPAPVKAYHRISSLTAGTVRVGTGASCGGYFVHPLAKWMILLLISAFSRNCAYTDEGMQEHFVG